MQVTVVVQRRFGAEERRRAAVMKARTARIV
jgi:hypothetical protein